MNAITKAAPVSLEQAVALANATPQGAGGLLKELFAAAAAAGITVPTVIAWLLSHSTQINKAVADILGGASLTVIVADLVALMQHKTP